MAKAAGLSKATAQRPLAANDIAECRGLGGCADAKIISGYRLRARHVIHAAIPVWRGGADGEDASLASCYRRSLEIEQKYGAGASTDSGGSRGGDRGQDGGASSSRGL
jgi:O-acetyl-ADP-ribose deacetylase (regulator of RNase III)